jgi:transposase InsO family protein
VLTARCNAAFCLWQLYAAAVQEDQIFEDVPPDALYDLILEGLAEDHTAKEARTALGLPGGYEAENHCILAVLLRQYQSHWKQHDGLLYYRMQLYVPAAGGARTEVLRRHHDDPIAGHFGAKRTLEFVARKDYGPGMSREVKAYTRACLTCQRVRLVRHRPYRSMEPLPQPRGPWTDISMDFIVGLLESRRKRNAKPYNAILVVVDQYTKPARCFPCHDSLDAIRLAEILARKLVLRGAGVPQSVISDHGPQFTSKFWAAFCHHLRINRRLSTAYHPQTEVQTELQNQTLEQYLRAYVNYLQDNWVYWLPLAEFAYNNSVHASTGVTPFYAEKGFHPSIEATVQAIPADGTFLDVPDAKARAEQLVELRTAIEQRWKKVTATQRKYADRRTKPHEFEVGDMVWL